MVEDVAFGDLETRDLAFAIWRRSLLARGDARTALAVVGEAGQRSSFSYELPVDGAGRPDLAATRWVDLEPLAWRQREIEGEVELAVLDERWRLRWALVPKLGFGDRSRPLGDIVSGLLRGATARPRVVAPLVQAHAAMYGPDLELLVAPWSAGTPPFDPLWAAPPVVLGGVPPVLLGAVPPAVLGEVDFSAPSRVRTPAGLATVWAVRSGESAAALFVIDATPLAMLERLGSFAVGVLLLLLAAAVGGALVAAPLAAVGAALQRTVRSYSKRLVIVFTVLLTVPLFLLFGLVTRAVERHLESEQEERALEAQRSAQRILGEYVLSLDPGFGIDTALDDRLLEWVARVVRHDVNLYWGSGIYASSKRELFAAGILPRRIPAEAWKEIALAGERLARRTTLAGGNEYLELYAPLEIPGVPVRQTQLVLALPLLAQQEELAAETARIRRRALLGLLALCGLLAATGVALARRFTDPIVAIVAGTRRIADGAAELGYRPDEAELEALAEAIDRMAARVAEGRERLLAEKGLVERIVESVTAAIVALDREGNVLLANRFARDRLAARPGQPLADDLRTAGLGELSSAFERARPGDGEQGVAGLFAGQPREWTLVRVPLAGGGEPTELVVVEDVTDVARAQRLEAWAAMARIIAHEIKNPLTPIRLSAEHLREAWARDREHFAAVFERCIENILAQVEELRLTASEFSLFGEIPRMERQPCDLVEVVRDVVDGYRAAPPQGVTIAFDGAAEPLVALADRRLLGRAIRNLIENAVRASSAGGGVEVEVAREEGGAAIRVADRGPGVPPEILARVLEPYFSTQIGGTGLGLPIARRIAEEHGGALALRNVSAGGFEVTITIPLA